MIQHDTASVAYFTFGLLDALDGVTNIVSTRTGGVSVAPFDSLNLGLHVGDDDKAVAQNRAALCNAVGVDSRSLVTGEQVHGTHIAIVTESDRGRGSLRWSDSIPQTDGLVTDVPDLPLMVLVADCVVLSFLDPGKGVIGLAHGGWRGMVGGIGAKMIAVMQQSFGSRPDEIRVGVSPSIGPCCYEVGQEVVAEFISAFGAPAEEWFHAATPNATHLNLWKAAEQQMLDAGVRDDHIETAELCTACRTDLFYSHRADAGKTGRCAGLIALHS